MAWQWTEVKGYEENEYQVGVDEAGRGPCLGPVVAAAVLLPDPPADMTNSLWAKVTDSKKVTLKRRALLEPFIKKEAGGWGIGIATVEEIVSNNIRNATFLAMNRAVEDLIKRWSAIYREKYPLAIDRLLIDGNAFEAYSVDIPHTTLVKGDFKSKAIAAASILAKTERDRLIGELCDRHPCLDRLYGLRSNQGYPTPAHKNGINTYGITIYHRSKDRPCVGKPLIDDLDKFEDEE